MVSRSPTLPLTGGCLCRAIRYEITALPLIVYACHCTNCQRQSGSAFAMNMPVATDAFRITQGEPTAWRRITPSGAQTKSWFCPACAGRIHGSRPTRPEIRHGARRHPGRHVLAAAGGPFLHHHGAALADPAAGGLFR